MVHSDIHDPLLILRLRFSQFSQMDRYRFTQEVLNTERYLSRNSILRPISITTHFYRPQRSWGKVMFLHVSVILFTGGGLPQGILGYPPPEQTPPLREQCMLGDTGNKRAVRILLECILVSTYFCSREAAFVTAEDKFWAKV